MREVLRRCGTDPTVKTIAILGASWAVLLLLGTFIPGFVRADTALLASLVLRALLVSGIALALFLYLGSDLSKGYRAFKAFVGYALFFSYVATAIAGAAWMEAGAIGAPLAWASWIAALLECAPGLALYLLLTRPSWRVRLGVTSKEDAQKKVRYRPAKPRTLGGKVLDNVDAVVQAIIMVAVIHATLFQLYVIPSGSMIPKFLIGDRVIVSKIQSGPRVPLSPFKLPAVSPPKRGDIIVFDNPFSEKPPVIRRMLNTLVFYLSLSTVNLDKEASGGRASDRVGTVVKRLVGMPGEKLMMLDDVLYRRTKDEPAWARVADDAKWANSDLYALPAELKRRMESEALSFTAQTRADFDAIDSWRSSTNPRDQGLALEAAAAPLSARGSASLLSSLPPASLNYLREDETGIYGELDRESARDGLAATFARRVLGTMTYSTRDMYREDLRLFLWSLAEQSRLDGLQSFLSAPAYGELDPYERAAAILNLRGKELMAKRFSLYLGLLRSGDVPRLAKIAQADPEGLLADKALLYDDWLGFIRYMGYFDLRSFPEFPSGQAYLGKDDFFLMGDNRYGSLDFRLIHPYDGDPEKRVTVTDEYYDKERSLERVLDASDPSSLRYQSQLKPRTLPRERILGKVLFTFWPPR